jgi:hypothetical protein
MSEKEAISIKQLAASCRQEHAKLMNKILALKKIIEIGLPHLSREDLVLTGARIKILSNLLSDLDSYIVAIQVSDELLIIRYLYF